MRRFRIVPALVALLVAALLGACTAQDGPTFVDEGGTYTQAEAVTLLEKVDTGDAAGQPAADSAALRTEALTQLRSQGDSASSAADLLTKTFGASTSGVPVYVERASFEDRPAIVVVEVIGPKGGELSDKRLWVVAEDDGSILYSGVR